jgi:hypothetical protein
MRLLNVPIVKYNTTTVPITMPKNIHCNTDVTSLDLASREAEEEKSLLTDEFNDVEFSDFLGLNIVVIEFSITFELRNIPKVNSETRIAK